MAKGDVLGRLPCPVCKEPAKVKEDVNGSPYWVCGHCGCRTMVGRDPEAAAKVRAMLGKGAPAADPAPAAKPKEGTIAKIRDRVADEW